MKKIILSIFCLTILYSCSNDFNQENQKEIVVNEKIGTRAIVDSNHYSISNPQLFNNWENIEEIVLNNGNRVTLPWVSGAQSLIPVEMSTDIKKEDGWKLLVHTFKDVGLDVGQNYMLFYNELRGILKVFFYKEGQPTPANGFLWYISQDPSSSTIFENGVYFSNHYSQRRDTYTQLTNASSNPVDGLIGESWNCFEFIIPYTNSTINNFSISAYNNTISDYSFKGKTESTTRGTIMQANEKSPNVNVPKAVANLAGTQAKNYIDTLATSWETSSSISQFIKDAILGVTLGDYTTAIKSGLNLLSGSILGWKSTGSTTQTVNLKTSGTITLSGTSSTSLVGQISPLALFGNSTLNDFYNGNLGVWDLQSIPRVYYERYTSFRDQNGNSIVNYPTTVNNGTVLLPLFDYDSYIPIIINPAIMQYVTSINVTPRYFFYEKIDGELFLYDKINQYTNETDIEKIMWDTDYQIFERKYNPPMQAVRASGQMGKGTNWYDWGIPDVIKLNCGANITVELEFNYHGKIHKIISSRNYKADVFEMEGNNDIPNYPNNYIVNNAVLSLP